LKYEEGSYEFVFPMVVGPRYLPGEASIQPRADAAPETTTSVPDAARISPPVIPEGMRAGHDISIEVALDAGLPVESLTSASHEIEMERPSASRAVVSLKEQATIPNKDFILKYTVAGRKMEDALLAHRSAKGSFFTLILQPPERVTIEDVTPKELVFVIDTSGSMSGFPLAKARETAGLALDNLNPQDTFNLITFAGDEHVLFSEPVPATPENLSKAKEFLDSRRSEGGTEMMKAIRAALDSSDASNRIRIACFMTDGFVGNDTEIIAEVQKHPNARVFAMGFSSAPNRFLLDKMAEYGRGEVDYVTEEKTDAQAVAHRFQERVRNPLLTDISIDWAGLPVADVYPQRIPDLFSARPLILTGRFTAGGRAVVRLQGKMSGRDFVREIPIELPDANAAHDVLATVWARQRINELMGQSMNEPATSRVRQDAQQEITQLGLEFRLMTEFTSFVAVEETIVTDGGNARRVEVPVEAPSMTTTSSVTETVSLQSSAASTVNTVDNLSVVDNAVEQQATASLPLNGRSFKSLLLLSPGIVPTGTRQPGNVVPDQFSINGQRPGSNAYFVDGVSANFGIAAGQNPGRTAAGIVPGLTASGGTNNLVAADAILEVTIRTASFPPEYGRVAGGLFQVTTRSGTNQFHGSLYEYVGNDAFDANDWFANSRGLGQPPRRLNNFGGTFSGPLKRDSTFFFAAYEGLRLRQPAVGLTDVPSLAARSLAPLALQPFLNAYPRPNGAARFDGFAEFAGSYANPARHDATSLRVDHRLTDRLYLFARYNYAPSSAAMRGADNSSLNTLDSTRSTTQTLTASLSDTISPTSLAVVRGNYSRLNVRNALRLDDFGGASVPSAAFLFPPFFTSGSSLSVFDLNGRHAALAAGDEVENVQRQFNFVGTVIQIKGSHTLKYGADYRRLSPVIGFEAFEQSVLFNRVAGALSGTASRLNLFARTGPQQPVFHNLSFYGQDEWRVTPRLMLTYGVRWEINPPPSSATGREPFAITKPDDPARLSLASAVAPLWETTYGNFAPRVGLAYQLSQASGRETVARASFSVLYDLGNDEAGLAFTDSFPFLGGQTLFDLPFPLAALPTPPAVNPQAPAGIPFVAFDPHLRLPYTLQWLVGVEQALGSKQALNASYVGTVGRRLLRAETLLNPGPDFSFLRLTTNGAKSDYHSLQLQYIRRLSDGLQALASYTWSRSIDDASQDSLAQTLLASSDAEQERGPSDFDVRHQLMGALAYMLPTPKLRGTSRALLRNWTIDAVINARSARPLSVVYGVPTVYGFAYLRPDLRAGAALYLDDAGAAGGRRLNPAAFEIPANQRQGTLGRNSLRGFPLSQLDFALRRQFDFTERVSLQFKAEVFNLLNHPNFEDPATTDTSLGSRLSMAGPFLPNTTFGESASMLGRSLSGGASSSFSSFYQTGGPRTFQFSLKLQF
jgi:hypothetical protein